MKKQNSYINYFNHIKKNLHSNQKFNISYLIPLYEKHISKIQNSIYYISTLYTVHYIFYQKQLYHNINKIIFLKYIYNPKQQKKNSTL